MLVHIELKNRFPCIPDHFHAPGFVGRQTSDRSGNRTGIAGATNSLFRSFSTSGIPETGVETTGSPEAIASSNTLGMPSRSPSAATTDGCTSTGAA